NSKIIGQWSGILEQNWDFDENSNEFICDDHFDERYIIRKDVITIPGQESFISERRKIILKENAIPTLKKSTLPSENETGSTASNICDSVVMANKVPVDSMGAEFNIEQDITEVESRLTESSDFSTQDLIKNLEINKLPKKWSWVDDHN
ncbi:hypothetical protein PV327_011318, partial [Microctonus hyperodae]